MDWPKLHALLISQGASKTAAAPPQPRKRKYDETKVIDLHVDYSLFQCMVELPPTIQPGDRCLVQWPQTRWTGNSPPVFVVEIPQSLKATVSDATKPQKLLVVAPNSVFDPLKESRLALQSEKWQGSRGRKSSVRVGRQYQVDKVPPVCRGCGLAGNARYDQLWDDQLAAAASRCGQDVDGFLSEASELNSKVLRMETLHKSNYCVDRARLLLAQILEAKQDIPIALNQEQAECAAASPAFLKKKFHKASADIGRSACACIVHYYNSWKKSPAYALKIKLKRKQQLCNICYEGGNLGNCLHCNDAYHWACLEPLSPDKPSDAWHIEAWCCAECGKSDSKLRKPKPRNVDPKKSLLSSMSRSEAPTVSRSLPAPPSGLEPTEVPPASLSDSSTAH